MSANPLSPRVNIGGGQHVSVDTGALVLDAHTSYGDKAGALDFGKIPSQFVAGLVVAGAMVEAAPKHAGPLPAGDTAPHLVIK